jgi:hypothetical protein
MSIFALTLPEAADSASIPRSLLEGLIVLNQGPKARRVGNRVLILREDLESWLRSLPETRITELRDAQGARHE